jgi:CHAD domain-containing protein
MKNSLFNNYLLNLLDSLEQNLSAYTKEKNPESIHCLRLDIKKIKAVLSFAEYIYKEKCDATRLNPLFHKAGEIREMHLNIHLLSLVPHPPQRLITQLKNKENVLIQQFIENGSEYITLIKDFSSKICFLKIQRSKKTIIKHFKKEQKKAKKILQHKDRESMHGYRKKIKKIIYIYNVLPEKMQNKINLKEAKIDKQQKKLGEWHDTYAAIQFLSHEDLPLKTSAYILKLKEDEKRQFKDLLNYVT